MQKKTMKSMVLTALLGGVTLLPFLGGDSPSRGG